MATNDRIILDEVLKQRQSEVDPNTDPSDFLSSSPQSKSSKTSIFHMTRSSLVSWAVVATGESTESICL